MSREAMKLALEALETIAKVEHPSHKVTYRKPVNGHVVTIYPHKVASDAIAALKQALEQPEPEPREHPPCKGMNCGITRTDQQHSIECQAEHAAAIAGGRFVKLEQPEPEPVAWRNAAMRVGEDLCSVGPFGYYDMTAEQWLDWALSVVTVHAPPPKREPPCKTGSQCTTECMECAEQEPVIDKSAAIRIATSLGWTPQRKPLTDEEIWNLAANCLDSVAGRLQFARAIEAAHGING